MVAVKIGRATGTLQKNGPFTVVRPRHGKEHIPGSQRKWARKAGAGG